MTKRFRETTVKWDPRLITNDEQRAFLKEVCAKAAEESELVSWDMRKQRKKREPRTVVEVSPLTLPGHDALPAPNDTGTGTELPHGENSPPSATSAACAEGYTDGPQNAQNAASTPGQSSNGIIVSPASGLDGAEVGRHSALEGQNAHDAASGAVEIPRGDVEAQAERSGDLVNGDEPLRVEAILAKWEAGSIGQDYRPRTKAKYAASFRRFALVYDLEAHDRRWLSNNGKRIIIEWVMSLREKSRATCLAALQSVWTFGIPEQPWPVNKRRDFGRKVFPQAGSRACPDDSDIEPIFRAALREDDPYLKSLILCALNEGGRDGNQLGQFYWGDVQECEGTLAIVAESKPGRKFKSESPVIWRLPPVASEAVRAWKTNTSFNAPDDHIWPRRPHGKLARRQADDHTMNREWHRFLERHQITTWVRLANLRHWVEVRGEADGISNVLLAYMRGHAVKKETEGGLGYGGNRKAEKVLSAQADRWPEGPTGCFTAREVRVVDELTPYMALVSEYAKGKMTTDEYARRSESLRLGLLKPTADIVP